MTIATANHAPVGVLDRLVELLGIADLAEQREDGDERADRHEQARGVDPVELLERRRLGPDRGRRRVPQRRRAAPCAPFVRARVGPQLVAERGGLQEGERGRQRVASRRRAARRRRPGRCRRCRPCSRGARRRRRRGARRMRRRSRARSPRRRRRRASRRGDARSTARARRAPLWMRATCRHTSSSTASVTVLRRHPRSAVGRRRVARRAARRSAPRFPRRSPLGPARRHARRAAACTPGARRPGAG